MGYGPDSLCITYPLVSKEFSPRFAKRQKFGIIDGMKDEYGRTIDYLRISITDRCNLRCVYCMPEEGVRKFLHEDMLSLEEVAEIARAFVAAGVKKIRLTGGEPAVRLGYIGLIEDIAKTGAEVVMTTNGQTLEQTAEALSSAGLSRVNISLDTLQEEKYRQITRGGDLQKTLRGMDAALSAGLSPVKINAVLMKGINDDEICALTDLTRDRDIHVRFIELMPIGFARAQESKFLPVSYVTETLPELIPEQSEGVAKRFRLPGAVGTVGLITPLSDHFCHQCNRVRMQADGKIKLCLHADPQYDMKEALRSGKNLEEEIANLLRLKPREHHLCEGEQLDEGMSMIGG